VHQRTFFLREIIHHKPEFVLIPVNVLGAADGTIEIFTLRLLSKPESIIFTINVMRVNPRAFPVFLRANSTMFTVNVIGAANG